jgi:hypothetical protein
MIAVVQHVAVVVVIFEVFVLIAPIAQAHGTVAYECPRAPDPRSSAHTAATAATAATVKEALHHSRHIQTTGAPSAPTSTSRRLAL